MSERNAYDRALYEKSERYRIGKINRNRRLRGQPEVSCLSQVKLRTRKDDIDASPAHS